MTSPAVLWHGLPSTSPDVMHVRDAGGVPVLRNASMCGLRREERGRRSSWPRSAPSTLPLAPEPLPSPARTCVWSLCRLFTRRAHAEDAATARVPPPRFSCRPSHPAHSPPAHSPTHVVSHASRARNAAGPRGTTLESGDAEVSGPGLCVCVWSASSLRITARHSLYAAERSTPAISALGPREFFPIDLKRQARQKAARRRV
jgi:hypothetical protein